MGLFTERNRIGRGTEVAITGPTRNRLSPCQGTVGSNPTLSALLMRGQLGNTFLTGDFGESGATNQDLEVRSQNPSPKTITCTRNTF